MIRRAMITRRLLTMHVPIEGSARSSEVASCSLRASYPLELPEVRRSAASAAAVALARRLRANRRTTYPATAAAVRRYPATTKPALRSTRGHLLVDELRHRTARAGREGLGDRAGLEPAHPEPGRHQIQVQDGERAERDEQRREHRAADRGVSEQTHRGTLV